MSPGRHLCRGYTATTVPIAVIAFEFDPLAHLGDFTVRWQTLALALVVAVCLTATGVIARRHGLRADDLLFAVIGAAPGAVVGGRIGYLLLAPDAFRAGPLSLFDPSVGGLELGGAVLGGLGTAWVVATMLGSPAARWADLASVPLLVGIAAGKLAMALGGSGQGRPFDGQWATAYLGSGPWVGLAASVPSHPAQVYEAIGTGLVAMLLLIATALALFRAPDGSRLLAGLAGWFAVRALVSTTWRDPHVLGTIPAGGVLAIVAAAVAIGAVLAIRVWRPRQTPVTNEPTAPSWPDPEQRPPY